MAIPTTYPDDCLQSYIGNWWEEKQKPHICVGRLLRVFVPISDHVPNELIAEGRVSPTDHKLALFRLESLDVRKPHPAPKIPVAALPHHPKERQVVYRGKVRPAIVYADGGREITAAPGAAKWQTIPTSWGG